MTPDKYSEYLANCSREEYEAHMGRGEWQTVVKKKKVQKKAKKKAKRV
jgi:hypothetical protein